jgi:hypothetical protein
MAGARGKHASGATSLQYDAAEASPFDQRNIVRKLRLIVASAVAVIAALAFTSIAAAQNPHFIRASSGLTNSGALTATFKIAGLGDNETISVTLSAQATAQYACFNRGGNHPEATNKETVSGPVSATGLFTSGQNGQVNGSLTAGPPSPGDFSCPPGQNLVLTFVQYTGVTLTAVTAEGTITATLANQTFGALV